MSFGVGHVSVNLVPLSFFFLFLFFAELEEAASSGHVIRLEVREMFSFSGSVRPHGVKEHQNKQSVQRGNEREYCLGAQTQQL